MRAFITRQAASVIGWTQGDEIMYGREFALHSLQHRLAAPRPGDAIAAVARFTAYSACPASGYQETHSPGGRRSAPDPSSRGTENLRQRHHAGRAGTPPPAARAVQALAVKAGLD